MVTFVTTSGSASMSVLGSTWGETSESAGGCGDLDDGKGEGGAESLSFTTSAIVTIIGYLCN